MYDGRVVMNDEVTLWSATAKNALENSMHARSRVRYFSINSTIYGTATGQHTKISFLLHQKISFTACRLTRRSRGRKAASLGDSFAVVLPPWGKKPISGQNFLGGCGLHFRGSLNVTVTAHEPEFLRSFYQVESGATQ